MYFYRLVMLVAITSLLMSGCASLPDPHVRITSPANGAVITLSADRPPVRIIFSIDAIPATNDPLCRYLTFQVEASDNGASIGGSLTGAPDRFPTGSCSSGAASPAQDNIWTWFPQSLGLHTLSAHIVITNDTGTSRQYDSNSVTVCVVGDPLSPPQNIPIGRTNPECQPSVPPTFTPVPTATATPVTPVPIRPNPHNPGGTNPSGCAALTNQTDCNLAGCSWNPQNSTCSVNP